jgi:hypothetical protein
VPPFLQVNAGTIDTGMLCEMRTRALDESESLVAIEGSKLQERGREVFAN